MNYFDLQWRKKRAVHNPIQFSSEYSLNNGEMKNNGNFSENWIKYLCWKKKWSWQHNTTQWRCIAIMEPVMCCAQNDWMRYVYAMQIKRLTFEIVYIICIKLREKIEQNRQLELTSFEQALRLNIDHLARHEKNE